MIASRGPGSKTPGRRPRSRARGRGAGRPQAAARARYSASGSWTRTGRAFGSSQRRSRCHRVGLEGGAARGHGLGRVAQVQEDAAPAARARRARRCGRPRPRGDRGRPCGACPRPRTSPCASALRPRAGCSGRTAGRRRRRASPSPGGRAGAGRGSRLVVAGDEAQVEDAGRRAAVAFLLDRPGEPAPVKPSTPGEAGAPERAVDRRADRRPGRGRSRALVGLENGTSLVPARGDREHDLPALRWHGRGREQQQEREHEASLLASRTRFNRV